MESDNSKDTTISLAATFAAFLIAFMFAFMGQFQAIYGIEKGFVILSNPLELLGMIFSDGAGASVFLSEVFGRSILFLAFIHLAVSQLFKSKRNPNSRRKIIIGWSVVSVIITIIAMYSAEQHHKVQSLQKNNPDVNTVKKEPKVFYATEINDNLIGHGITAEGAERYAIFAKDAFKRRMRTKYEEAGFSLDYLPSVSHKILLLEVSGKTIANIVFESIGETSEGSKTSYFIHVIGIDHNKMYKVICEGVKNFVDDDNCYSKVTEVFGEIL
jgi:hypothetical protein